MFGLRSVSGADLRETHLQFADLRGVILDGADLTCANMSGTDFTGATGITKEQLQKQAEYLNGAIAPDGLQFHTEQTTELRPCPESATFNVEGSEGR